MQGRSRSTCSNMRRATLHCVSTAPARAGYSTGSRVWVLSTATPFRDADAVHFDYQPGNVLVHPNRPDEVTAIVDWGGAVASSGGFDLVTLAWSSFGPAGEQEGGVDEYLWRLVRQLPEAILVPSWAHLSLRLMYWAIRFRPDRLGHWVQVSERLVEEGSIG